MPHYLPPLVHEQNFILKCKQHKSMMTEGHKILQHNDVVRGDILQLLHRQQTPAVVS